MARKLKIGDVVQLRSERSPEMTVESVSEESANVVWFDCGEDNVWKGPFRDTFPVKSLVHTTDGA